MKRAVIYFAACSAFALAASATLPATSLPLLLIFEDDLEAVKNARMENLNSLAEKGLETFGGTSK